MAQAPCTTAGCSNTCQGNCKDGCSGCKGSCGDSCGWRACNASCDSSCQKAGAWNSGSCSCGTNCSNKCSSCYGSCTSGCAGSSSGSSTSGCSTCGTSCENNCASNCKGDCKAGCTGTCQDTCSGKCTGTCQLECSYGCVNSTAVAAYRKLKLTEYITSSNVIIIISFILDEIKRIEGIENFDYDKELSILKTKFAKLNYGQIEAINYLIELLNNVKIDKRHDSSLTESKYLFDLQKIENEEFITQKTGNELINCAKILFNTKKLVYD